MAEWLYEAGIGEARAALVEHGEIVELLIELEGDGALRAGAVLDARLTRKADATGRGLVVLTGGEEATLDPVPPGLTEGATIRVEVVREALPERGRTKPPRVRAAPADRPVGPGPSLHDRIAASGLRVVRLLPHEPDRLEEAGWSERLEEAMTGDFAFPWGALRMDITPAMTLFDVDGALGRAELARAGAEAAGQAIRRLDIGGSIGIDLPTLSSKADRQAAAAALDDALPPPFERTAVNGFGFLQIVRRRTRPSIPELLMADSAAAAARALLRRAERAKGVGSRTLIANPQVIHAIEREPQWPPTLAGRIGAPVILRPDPALAISAGHVETDHP